MIPKCSSTFFITILTFLTLQASFQVPEVHAAPISRLLSVPPSSAYSAEPSSQISSSSPTLKRQSDRSLRLRFQSHPKRARSLSESYLTSPSFDSAEYPATWDSLQDQQRLEQKQQQPIVPVITEMMWTDRTLEGHAVVDVDDDDDGNELLDTESDGLWGPDADEEIEETIEGEILEEEDYGQDDRDDGVDMDQDEGLDLDDEVWKGVIHKLSTVAGLSRKEAMANSRNNIVGSSSLPVPVV